MPRPKLDPQQITPHVAPQMLVGLLDLVGEFGVAPERLCEGLGFSVENLRRGEQISDRQAWRMIRRAMQLTGRADLGLELGRRENLGYFGLPGFTMSTARTLGEAIDIGLRYQGQTGTVTDWSLEEDDRHFVMVIDSKIRDASVLPFLMEEAAGSVLVLIRILVGDHFTPLAMEFTYPQPAHADRYRELFACPLRFGAAHNRFLIERHWLDTPIATHSAAMSAQMRTLRRRLSEDGTSFHAISERIHAQTAQRLLSEQGMTVAATGEQLGFSDARAFRRTFKRWLGRVPGAVRRSTRAPGK